MKEKIYETGPSTVLTNTTRTQHEARNIASMPPDNEENTHILESMDVPKV